ncbi:MAG: phosphoribosylformylglycinamidine cyclo-ligase [Spirochaetaceae bacterium]|nr:phosphoribosylformylglycinamidine cyclo-ligase [Spirochaetaceae bacterium]
METSKSFSESYKNAGVDIQAGYEAVRLMKKHVERTNRPGVLSGLGGFGGLFELDLAETPHPVLVSGTDGVGTKLRVAFLLDRHDTVGIDCVAMCVNDVVCSGARPLVFLDYIACGKNEPRKIAAIVEGVAEGCVQAGCVLSGGETAEMPGFYAGDEYDLAGFAVGVVDKAKIFDNAMIREGDAVIALPSSGLHSNGFSLVRRVFGLDDAASASKALGDYKSVLGKTLGEELLIPTRIYVKPLLALAEGVAVMGACHITGGGFYENIPRCLPDHLSIRIKKSAVRSPAIFGLLAERGGISERDMFNTFNMGVGMVVVVRNDDGARALSILKGHGVDAYAVGELVSGCGGVELA